MLIAVMDLGSNSFKMTVAQWAPELSKSRPFRVLHKERHPIQLGGSVFSTGSISAKDWKEAIKALTKMQARIRDFSAPVLRVVATSAIRDATNGRAFVKEVRERLGIPIEVISGVEEARLIAQGLQWEYPRIERGLLVDIGGGSTEIAAFGNGWDESFCHSFRSGSVRLATQYFRSRKNIDLEKVRRAIQLQLKQAPPKNVERLIGSAGSIQSIGKIVSPSRSTPLIRKSTLDRWLSECLKSSPADLADRYELTPSRARVVVPGAIILSEILAWLKIDELSVTSMTLRDGLMVDLVASWQSNENQILSKTSLPRHSNPKAGVERQLLKFLENSAQTFQVDVAHARHIAMLATSLFDQMVETGAPFAPEERKYLLVAAYLHDAGKIISEPAHQKHSAYILRNLQIPGLNPLEWKKCALIALYHRKDNPPKKDPLPGNVSGVHATQVRRMAALLRLVDGLDEDHTQNIDSLVFKISKKQALLELVQIRSDVVEMEYFREKSAYFEELFGLKIVSFVHPRRLGRGRPLN